MVDARGLPRRWHEGAGGLRARLVGLNLVPVAHALALNAAAPPKMHYAERLRFLAHLFAFARRCRERP